MVLAFTEVILPLLGLVLDDKFDLGHLLFYPVNLFFDLGLFHLQLLIELSSDDGLLVM
jgi:hypothetical protein